MVTLPRSYFTRAPRMPDQLKTEESLVHKAERKVTSSSPAADRVFFWPFYVFELLR